MAENEVKITGTIGGQPVSISIEFPFEALFAAFALAGFRANPNGVYTTYEDAAREAFNYADAMEDVRHANALLAAREGTGE